MAAAGHAAAALSQAATLQFSPAHAALGGAVLAAATVGRMRLSGRVLGISGAVKVG